MDDTTPALHWVRTGGPLLLLPEALLDAWHGADGPSPQHTDFERAALVDGYIARLVVGRGAGVVLGDEPLPTTWLPAPDGNGGILARLVYAPSDEAINAAVAGIPADLEWDWEGFSIRAEGTPLVLFDAAYAGNDLPASHVRLAVAPGTYEIQSAPLKPSDDTALLLHRLVRVG